MDSNLVVRALSALAHESRLAIFRLLVVAGPDGTAAGEIAQTKIAATGTAPGAGYAKFEWVAGTNGGSCKMIAYAGTSTTPVTVIDNVGSGC